MVERMPAVLGTRPRAVDEYRDLIGRYSIDEVIPAHRLPNRAKVLDVLTEELRPLLDAIAEADASAREVARLRALASDGTSTLASVARLSLLRAEDRWRIASARVRQETRDERTLLRYQLLRFLVRR